MVEDVCSEHGVGHSRDEPRNENLGCEPFQYILLSENTQEGVKLNALFSALEDVFPLGEIMHRGWYTTGRTKPFCRQARLAGSESGKNSQGCVQR